MRNKILISSIIFVTIFIFLVGFFLIQQKEKPIPEKRENISYSIFFPGKTTREEIIAKAGIPSSTQSVEGKELLYYDTQNPNYKDLVVIRDGILLYAQENIFSDEEISLKSILSSYGDYKTYSSEGTPFVYHVFLEKGIAVEAGEVSISKILYFVPQTEKEFLNSIGKDLGIAKEATPELLRP